MKRSGKAAKAFETTIEKLVYGGAGLGRYQGKVVFVPFSVPGDCLLVRPVAEKRTFVRAEIIRVLSPGSGRVPPPCPHFAKCGGCHWQQLGYPGQVEAKRRILEEVFYHRFPQTREFPITMQACPQPFAYRSRARVQLRGSGSGASVGFFRSGSRRVEDIDACPLFRPALNEALSSLRQYKLKVDRDSDSAEMDMACSEEEDTWATARSGSEAGEGISILIGTRRKEEVILRRRIEGFLYSVTASVFFQANDFMTPKLMALVRESAKNAENRCALDLFSGVGLFTLPLARQFGEVVAVESSAAATRLLAGNAGTAGLRNIRAVCADASAWIESLSVSPDFVKGKFDLIVLDPPRAGVGPGTMKTIGEWAPETIIYVSCDPQTLVRDLAEISPRDYEIDLVKGLDMFPQTYHFETVLRLRRKGSR